MKTDRNKEEELNFKGDDICKMKQNRSISMKTATLAAVIIVAFLILSLCPSTTADVGLGSSPSRITVGDVVRGGTYERTLTIFNTGDEIGTFNLTAEGDCSDWISFYNADNLTMPIANVTIANKWRVQVVIRFDIPEDMPNGNYTTKIYVQSTLKKEGGGGTAQAVARLRFVVPIRVTGIQNLSGTVENITTAETEVGYPLKIRVAFRNDGDVIAKPAINTSITKNGTLVDCFVDAKTGIKPGCNGTITVRWNTTGREQGDYIATVNVSLGNEALATRELPFTLLPYGTLTREGELKSLSIEGDLPISSVIKAVAKFENTGMIDLRAKFKAEIYRNDEFVEVLESDEKLVEVGETAELIAYYNIPEPGYYRITGYVTYDGKNTTGANATFNVVEATIAVGTTGVNFGTTAPGETCNASFRVTCVGAAKIKFEEPDGIQWTDMRSDSNVIAASNMNTLWDWETTLSCGDSAEVVFTLYVPEETAPGIYKGKIVFIETQV